MTVFEFIIIMTGIGMSGLGYLLAYKNLKKQVRELKKQLENDGNEE